MARSSANSCVASDLRAQDSTVSRWEPMLAIMSSALARLSATLVSLIAAVSMTLPAIEPLIVRRILFSSSGIGIVLDFHLLERDGRPRLHVGDPGHRVQKVVPVGERE